MHFSVMRFAEEQLTSTLNHSYVHNLAATVPDSIRR